MVDASGDESGVVASGVESAVDAGGVNLVLMMVGLLALDAARGISRLVPAELLFL